MSRGPQPEREPASDPASGAEARPPLPAGVFWTPVSEVTARLKAAMAPVARVRSVPLSAAAGRYLAADVAARRAHPATDNAAVDGYAFAHPGVAAIGADGRLHLRLREGRAAAGAPWPGIGGADGPPADASHADDLPAGDALRILTGAPMPPGADTVALQEDAALDGAGGVWVAAPRRPGANRRRAGENIAIGQIVLRVRARLGPAALAQAASAGLAELPVRAPLRVAVRSTGDEIAPVADAGRLAAPWRVADANGPMLSALIARLGAAPESAPPLPDCAAAIAAGLDAAAEAADAIVVSGGASGGDEDHVTRLLADEAARTQGFHVWRAAMKPGRPFAAGLWRGAPVFALPGNPVAAFVCFVIFVRPALIRLAGGAWPTPQGRLLPSGFDYPKRPGRREYLRVRIGADGRLEKYRSEGSGLIEGLLWADGLADLPDDAGPVAANDPLRFLSFDELGGGP